MDYDFTSACLDEIALEGLDGITISSLWIRVANRPKFPQTLDANSKAFLWKRIAVRTEIEFYELPEDRKPLNIFDRYENVDVDDGIVTEPANCDEDIYPICLINESGVRGSCSSFYDRKDVTLTVRDGFGNLKFTLEEAVKKWNERLLLVANQKKRSLALLGPNCDPTIELTDMQYALLERIGRSRYQGEVTQGKMSLSVFKESPKSLHYQRKLLVKAELVTKQLHYQRSCNNLMVCGSLFHLTRFYVERKSKFLVLLQSICQILAGRPNRTAPVEFLREALGLKEASWKKIFNKHLYQFSQVISIPLKEAKPNLPPEKYFHANGTPKTARALQLLDNVDISKIGKEDDADFDEDDDDKLEPKDSAIKTWIPYLDRPLLVQTVQHLEQIGPSGASVREVSRSMNIPYLDSRLLLRNASRLKAVVAIYKDMGKQRCTKYVAKKHIMKSELRQQICNEGLKMLKNSKREKRDEANESELLVSSKNVLEAKEGTSKDVNTKKVRENKNKSDNETLVDFVKNVDQPEFDFENITYRKLKRVNIILKLVRQEKLIDNLAILRKAIITEESEEGERACVDPKTVRRLLEGLTRDKEINFIHTSLTCGDKVIKLQFVCDKDVTQHSSIVKSAIEQAKVKRFFAPLVKKSKRREKSTKKNVSDSDFYTFVTKNYEYLPNGKRRTEVKCVRLKLLHEFLYYLLYGYEGKDFEDSTIVWEPNKDPKAKQTPRVYKEEASFKRFIPPLPIHKDWPTGWCLMSDAILRLPLSLFMKLINCPYKVPQLDPYLNDPLKQHYLIGHLPTDIRLVLFHGRRYIFSFSQNVELLARIGLLSFGPQQYKEKEQRFMFLHRTAAVCDTRLSDPSYCETSSNKEYEKLTFYTNSLADVENFWLRAQEICVQTPLGCRAPCQGQAVNIERITSKPSMVAACAPKSIQEIKDDGTIPGDGRGAGGYDSALFAHLQRNWFSFTKSVRKSPNKNETDVVASNDSEVSANVACIYKNYLKQINENVTGSKRLGRLQRLNLTLKTKDKGLEIKVTQEAVKSRAERMRGQKRKRVNDRIDESIPKKARRTAKVQTRIICDKARISKRRPYYDEKDKEALKKQSKKRVDWNVNEDSFLLLCKVASVLLSPNHYQQLVVASPLIRDLMHEYLPNSGDKTSRACQRRVMYMMRNPRTKYNVAVYVGEAKQDETLMAQVVNPNVPKTDEVAWETAFKNTLVLVLAKFKSAKKISKNFELPDTIDELKARYTIISTDSLLSKKPLELEINNIVSLRFAVVYTLFLSAICSVAFKDKWVVHMYRLFTDYPDTLLRSVIARLRNDQVIANKKNSTSRARQKRLQLSSLPYQLHIAYANKLRTKYKPAIFEGARKFYLDLVEQQQTGEPLQLTNVAGGIAAGIIASYSLGRINIAIEDYEHLIYFEKDPNVEPSKKRQKVDELEAGSSKGSALLPKKASRVHLYMKRQQIFENPAYVIQHSQDFIKVIPCKLKIALKTVIEEKFESSTNNSNLDHDYLTDPKNKEVGKPGDWLISTELVEKVLKSQLKCPELREFDCVLKENLSYDGDNYVNFSNIFQFIFGSKELGVTLENIKEKFLLRDESNFKQYLDIMVSNGLVLRCGINVVKYVARENANTWLLAKPKANNSEDSSLCQEIQNDTDKNTMSKRRKSCDNDCDILNKFASRPWKMPDGTLNVEMFEMMLRAVLCCIMENGVIGFRDLLDQLLPTLQAVYALEIIEILEEIKCIDTSYMRKKKVTLFSVRGETFQEVDKSVGDPFKDDLSLLSKSNCILTFEDFVAKLRMLNSSN